MRLTLTGTVRRRTGGFELLLSASDATEQSAMVVLEGDEETMAQLELCVNEKVTLKGCWNPHADGDKATSGSLRIMAFDEPPDIASTSTLKPDKY